MTLRFSRPHAVLALGAFLLSGLNALAYNADTEKWKTSPVTMQLQLGSGSGTLLDGATSWGAVAEAALAAWNDVLTNFKFNVVRDSTAAQARGNRLNNVFFASTYYGTSFGSRTLAITLISTSSTNGVSNGYIETDVVFNSGVTWNSYRGPLRLATGTTYLNDFRRVAIHEFGHALGLDHPDDIGQNVTAVMNAVTSDTDTVATDDINGARFLYDSGVVVTAPAITNQPASLSATVGTGATFSVVATGTAPLTYQWRKNGTDIAGATAATYTLVSVATADAGTYTVVVTNSAGSLTSTGAVLTVTAAPVGPTTRLSNLSVLTTLAANQTLTVGFTMSGGSKSVLVRGVGPGLATLGVPGTMPDPTLTLFANSVRVTSNDDWLGATAIANAASAVGAFPLSPGSFDAALVRSISGGHTVEVTGSALASNPTANFGTVIVEVYDAGTGNTTRLTNLSALNTVNATNLLIAGFTLAGTGTKTVLIRAVGPGLTALGVGGALTNPKLELYNSSSVLINSNDDWASSLSTTFSAVGAFGLTTGSRDAALLVTLPAGGYTVQVSGVAGATGLAIIEVYEVP
jgi:hypothetical protein